MNYKVGIIGGGIAGSTIAIRLSELGIKTVLLEKTESLVNGPPICHLHAGGNLYREIPDEECVTLLKESIELVRMYPGSVDYRPTLIAVPTIDEGNPLDLLPRLTMLKKKYQELIDLDSRNQVLGDPDTYYKLYSREEVESLATKTQYGVPNNLDEWMVGAAKNMDLDSLKYPLVMVEEYGWNIFRLASIANLSLENNPNCTVITNANVDSIDRKGDVVNGWTINYSKLGTEESIEVDYLVNACGFRTGTVDDMVYVTKERMVEFKAAYITKWDEKKGHLPEIIFHGVRGTKDGMAQLTPYPGGYYQVHGMTKDITLFDDGLKGTSEESSQPQLADSFINKIDESWELQEVEERTERAIQHVARFVPEFATANTGGKPFYGAQQIPGDDPELRAASVSFPSSNYACCEIVKASSTLAAANAILDRMKQEGVIVSRDYPVSYFPITDSLTESEIQEKAHALCEQREYPLPMSGRIMEGINTNSRLSAVV